MTYTVTVWKHKRQGLMQPNSETSLTTSLDDAKEVVRAMRDGLPHGFMVELSDGNTGRTIAVD